MNTDPIADALRPLRPDSQAPEPHLVREVLDRHADRRSRRRAGARYRLLVAIPATTILVAVTFALLPGLPGGEPDSPGQPGSAVFATAAAVAGQRPEPVGFDGYRYTRQLTSRRQRVSAPKCDSPQPQPQYDGLEPSELKWRREHCPALQKIFGFTERYSEEMWVDAEFDGRIVSSRTELIDFEPGLARAAPKRLELPARTHHYRPSPGTLASVDLRDLPANADALRRDLGRVITRQNWTPAPHIDPDPIRRYWHIKLALTLVGEANSSGALRAAAFQVLADMPGARALGSVKDLRGRTGDGVELRVKGNRGWGPGVTIVRVIVDPATSDLLEWSDEIGTGPKPSGETRTYERFARVGSIGERP